MTASLWSHMLVLTREVGQAFVIEDVAVTLVSANTEYAEVSLQKLSGGQAVIATLPKNQGVAACYDSELIFIKLSGEKARLGIQAPRHLHISRKESLDDAPPNRA